MIKHKQSNEKNYIFTALSIVAEAGTLGFTLAICLIAGVFLGRYLDQCWNTSPWGLICFSVLGLVTGFMPLCRKVVRYIKTDQANETHRHDKNKG